VSEDVCKGGEPVPEGVPARVILSRRRVTVNSLLSLKRRPHFKTLIILENKNVVVGTDGSRNKELLC
jgi:hypothetical protein